MAAAIGFTRDLRPARPHQGLSFGLNRLNECVYGLPITGEHIFPLTSGLEGPGGLLMAVIGRLLSAASSPSSRGFTETISAQLNKQLINMDAGSSDTEEPAEHLCVCVMCV